MAIINTKTVYALIAIVAVCFSPWTTVHASTPDIIGVWSTEKAGHGYINVRFYRCKDKLCGNIVGAYGSAGEASETYEHIDKKMVWDMTSAGDLRWAKGKIWDPSGDKIYKSKMSLNSDDTLSVSGCLLLFCKSQLWTRALEQP